MKRVEFAKSLYPNTSLKNTVIIAVQHLLQTTHSMFQSWYGLKLEPHNIHVLGKCYSSNRIVVKRMLQEGINVSPLSFSFNSHRAFDHQFDDYVEQFLNAIHIPSSTEKIIVLDDGGHLIKAFIQRPNLVKYPLSGIEQTSSGYEIIKNLPLNFPIVNVARSNAKLSFEPIFLAEKISQQLRHLIKEKNTLVLGCGVIGKAIIKEIKPEMVYDKNDSSALQEMLPKADLIIGCTGNTSISTHHHHLLKKGCYLISASSSDREFDSVHLRKTFSPYHNCHRHLKSDRFNLMNSGFPINFTGAPHSIPPAKIELIRALITLGMLQASMSINRGIIPLDTEKEAALLKQNSVS